MVCLRANPLGWDGPSSHVAAWSENRRTRLNFALALIREIHLLSRLAEILAERYVGLAKSMLDI
uniref:Expressed protein n=1 Tax=Echinococcus granulosus TaxID=6210 RepID=A0A068WT05_ECHGR|nr:expressed protein [Echinococcus granulosus]